MAEDSVEEVIEDSGEVVVVEAIEAVADVVLTEVAVAFEEVDDLLRELDCIIVTYVTFLPGLLRLNTFTFLVDFFKF